MIVGFLGLITGRAATVVSGVQSGTWSRSQSPIEVADDVVVAAGATLTIEAGVEVRFREPWVDLWVEGALVALGTLENPIKFSSDENGVKGGQWGGIIIRDSSDDAATQLAHCVLEGGGGYREDMLRVESASPRISDCLLRLSRWRGITLVRSDASIQPCRFEDHREYAIAMDPTSLPVLRGNGAKGNGGNAIGIFGGNLARSGTWVRAPRVSDPSQVNGAIWLSSGYFSANDCNCWRRSVEPWSWPTVLRGPDESGVTFFLVIEIQTSRHYAKIFWKYTEKGP